MKLATLCYLRDDAKTLMLHRNKRRDDYHFGKWNGLGGKLLSGESPEEGARREIEEESGLFAGRLELKGIITFPLFDRTDDWYVFLFKGTQWQGTLRDSAEGELHWIDNSKLLELELWPGDRVFLPWLDENGFFSAKFHYRDGQFKDYTAVRY